MLKFFQAVTIVSGVAMLGVSIAMLVTSNDWFPFVACVVGWYSGMTLFNLLHKTE